MKKLAIDAGHGKNTAGKRCLKSLDPNETREWTLNQRAATHLQALLTQYEGIEIMRVDDSTGNTDVPISGASSRPKAANAWGADFYLSIHHDAGIKGGAGGGITTFVYTSPQPEELSWQKDIYSALIAAGGLKGNRSQPLNKQNLAVLRETNMPAVLIECGFMDSKTDVPVILNHEYPQKLAQGFCNVIVARWGLKKKLRQGDVNGDGKIDSSDARMALQHEVGVGTLTPEQLKRADANGDGKVDSSDARLILQKEVGGK